ncbi:MAG: DUF4276 family protein [Acidobacteria bacterium]|nr:DUF4276 family protein [Acidobacteriota bacterium]MBI3421555.1 DUF4276 family protein [Acidobacteriota bacterium]
MNELVFLLEEASMREVLKVILPQIVPPEISCVLITHEGKRDLEVSIPRKLRAWQNPGARFVIVRDQDMANCYDLKDHLRTLCTQAGRRDSLIRIACHELEAWFLGDMQAVSRAFELPQLKKLSEKRKFREPDLLGNAAEELQKLVRRYKKVGGARAVAPHLDLAANRSHSFRVFLAGIRRIVDAMTKES